MKKTNLKKYLKIGLGVFVFLLLGVKKTTEKMNVAITRYRYKFGLPFSSSKKTYIIKDVNNYNNEVVTHIFNYKKELAYQFINGKFNGILDLWSVE